MDLKTRPFCKFSKWMSTLVPYARDFDRLEYRRSHSILSQGYRHYEQRLALISIILDLIVLLVTVALWTVDVDWTGLDSLDVLDNLDVDVLDTVDIVLSGALSDRQWPANATTWPLEGDGPLPGQPSMSLI